MGQIRHFEGINVIVRCAVCRKSKPIRHYYKGVSLCSVRCNNQLMAQLEYKRERKGKIHRWPVRFHQQDLGGDAGAGLSHRRGWLYIGELELGWEYNLFGQPRFGLKLGVGVGDDDVNMSMSIPGISVYLGLEMPCGYRWLGDARESGVSIHDWTLYWEWWAKWGEWSSRTPKWRQGSFDVLKLLFGKMDYEDVLIRKSTGTIIMPEGLYECSMKVEKCRWTRRRIPSWLWNITKTHITMNVDGGIPIGGKGENSWDCGDDAIMTFTTEGNDELEACKKYAQSVHETRVRYGMPSTDAFLRRGKIVPEPVRRRINNEEG